MGSEIFRGNSESESKRPARRATEAPIFENKQNNINAPLRDPEAGMMSADVVGRLVRKTHKALIYQHLTKGVKSLLLVGFEVGCECELVSDLKFKGIFLVELRCKHIGATPAKDYFTLRGNEAYLWARMLGRWISTI